MDFPATAQRSTYLPLPPNNRLIAAIRERLCTIVERQAHRSLDELATSLDVETEPLRVLLDDGDKPVDVAFLIDVVASVVREFGVGPLWLLTGRYESVVHRRALALSENRTPEGTRALREFIREQYNELSERQLFS